MNFSPKLFNDLFEAMLQDSLEKGLISHAEEFPDYIKNQDDIGNYYVLDKAVIAKRFEEFYSLLHTVYQAMNVDIATGNDLDNLGAIMGIQRPSATYAMVELVFTSNFTEEDVRIEPGRIVSTSTGISYQTLEEVYIPSTESECTVPARAVIPGSKSKVVEDTLTILETGIPNISVTNPNGSSGGVDEYTDDQYRELLKNWRNIQLKGSLEAYNEYFSNFNGIDGYRIVPNWNGSGTVKIIIDPGLPIQLNTAYNELRSTVSQIDTDLFLTAPTDKIIDVYATVNVDIDRVNPYSSNEKELIQAKIISAIKIFIDGGYRVNGKYYPGLEIGEDFIPHKLSVFLDQEIPELKSISFQYPEDYIQILDDEKGKSNIISIEMI